MFTIVNPRIDVNLALSDFQEFNVRQENGYL